MQYTLVSKLTWLAGKWTTWRCVSYQQQGFSIAMVVYQRVDCKQSFLLTSNLTPGKTPILHPRSYPSGIRGFPIPPKHPSLARLWNIKPEWQQIVKIWETAWASTYKVCQHIHNQTILYNTMHTYNVVTSPELLEYPSNSTRLFQCNNPFEHEKQLGSGISSPYITQPVGLRQNFLGVSPEISPMVQNQKHFAPKLRQRNLPFLLNPGNLRHALFFTNLDELVVEPTPFERYELVKVGDFVFPSFFRGWKFKKNIWKLPPSSSL